MIYYDLVNKFEKLVYQLWIRYDYKQMQKKVNVASFKSSSLKMYLFECLFSNIDIWNNLPSERYELGIKPKKKDSICIIHIETKEIEIS